MSNSHRFGFNLNQVHSFEYNNKCYVESALVLIVPGYESMLVRTSCVLSCPQVGGCERNLRQTQQKLLNSEQEKQRLRDQVSVSLCSYGNRA